MDRNLFTETLREVAKIAKTAGRPLTKEEIRTYFAGMELSDEQEELIYQYLKAPAPDPGRLNGASDTFNEDAKEAKNFASDPENSKGASDASDADAGEAKEFTSDPEETKEEPDLSLEKLSDSVHYRTYLQEVRQRRVAEEGQQQILYERWLAGDGRAVEQIVDNWLMRVVEIAKEYHTEEVGAQDLIQEGNMALWIALQSRPEKTGIREIPLFLEGRIRKAMEDYIRDISGDLDRTQAVLGKAALLYEAKKILTEENGMEPSLRELGEYTHIAPEEIQDILAIMRPAPRGSDNS